jgi:hypothetical protein
MFKNHWKLACIALAVLPGAALAQEAPKDVPPSHWAYTAVQDLASKGLIKGYPPDNRFLGGRTLTRYEMATIIERVLARVDDLLGAKANKGDLDSKADKADIARLETSVGEIRDLITEFRKELLVIGTDLNAVKDELATLKGQVAAANAKAGEATTLAEQALENIREMKGQLKSVQDQLDTKATPDKATSLHMGGTFQLWALSALGGTPNGNNPTNFGSGGAGRQFATGGSPVGDAFEIKRGEFYLTGGLVPGGPNNPVVPGGSSSPPDQKPDKPGEAYYYVLLDTGKIVKNQNSSLQPNSTMLQDLFVGYQLARRFRFEIGQQKTGLDEEGDRSSAELWTIERSIMNLLPVIQNPSAPTKNSSGAYTGGAALGDVGRFGYVRDLGAVVRYNSKVGKAMVGIWDGNGESQAYTSQTRQKFADFNAYYTGIPHLEAGIWGGENFGDSEPEFKRDRFGATIWYQKGQHLFETEGGFARDFSPLYASGAYSGLYQGAYSRGGYALYGYTVTNKFQAVGRFDVWDPAYQSHDSAVAMTTIGGYTIDHNYHDLREYTLGFNYYPNGKYFKNGKPVYDAIGNQVFDNRFKIQLNYIVDAVESNGVSFWGKSRNLLIANFQAAF